MDELFPALIMLVITIGGSIASAAKNKEKQAARERHDAAAAARIRDAQQKLQQKAAKPQPAAGMSTVSVSGQVITPTVHTHFQPDCDTHDAPGSLGYASQEGKDPCHQSQLTHARTAEESEHSAGGLTFDWTGDSMVKAVVMQEVLTRPAQRRAR